MNLRGKIRLLFVAMAVLLAGLVLADSLGFFDKRPYREISHGNHSHYVPNDRDPNMSISDFPTRPPREGERITPYGQIVPETEGAAK
ncbi:MAG: hypothetical protein WD097_01620 [Balneolales bacterium]